MTIRSIKSGTINTLQVSGVTSVAVPTEPSITSATPSAGLAEVSVAFNASNLGPTATNFEVVSSPGSITASGATSPINVTGLTGNTSYTFTARAINNNGNSPYSSASTSVTTANPYTLDQTYTSSSTYTVPAGKTQVLVVVVGGGAAGNDVVGGAGSSGVAFYDYAVSAGQTFAINVAAASGTSNFGNLATASINVRTGSPANTTTVTGGTGGNLTPGEYNAGNAGNQAGLLSFPGNILTTTFRAGGGGGGGSRGNYGNQPNRGATPGGAGGQLGGGNGGRGRSGNNNAELNQPGQPGTQGGGGGGRGQGDVPSTAGSGGGGRVVIYSR